MRLIQAGEASETKARAPKVFDPLDTVLESDRVVAADGNEAEQRVLDSETSRPLLRRALITRRPVAERIRARKPEVRFRFRLVPSRVRLVITVPVQNHKF